MGPPASKISVLVACLVACFLAFAAFPLHAQIANIEGQVRDSTTGTPLGSVLIRIHDESGAETARVVTDSRGQFSISELVPGRHELVFSRFGYSDLRVELPGLSPGTTERLSIQLAPKSYTVDPIVVSVSRSAQASFNAPAAVTVVGQEEISEQISASPVDHLSGKPGFDMAQKGLFTRTFSARGMNASMQSIDLKALIDYRDVAEPVQRGLNSPSWPTADEDIERIELVRGPASVLYGPYAHNGVLHIITRSPLEEQGTVASLAGGEREFTRAAFRHSQSLNDRLAYKISGQYYSGNDWKFDDPVEVMRREQALGAGADPDTLLIGARDYNVNVAKADLRLDWKPDAATLFSASVGGTRIGNQIDLLPAAGARQNKNMGSLALQLRAERGDFSAKTHATFHFRSGESYLLRTGSGPSSHMPWVLAAQVQNAAPIGDKVEARYGIDYQHTNVEDSPGVGLNAGATVNEVGAFVYTEAALSSKLDATAAARLDHHDRLNDLAVSPRVGLVYKPGISHAIRFTYNRAFSPPSPGILLPNIVGFQIGPFPYNARLVGVPKDGFSFRRECDGLCMRSPFHSDPTRYLAADATLMWDAVVGILQGQGVDISDIPAPGSSDVETQLSRFDVGTFSFVPTTADEIVDIAGPERQFTQTLEAGYRGLLGQRLFVAVDLYLNRVENFLTALAVHTPNVFFDQSSLAEYLSAYRSPDQADQLAGTISGIPVGTISPEQSPDPVDLLAFPRIAGRATYWGADLAAELDLSQYFSVTGSYSWFSIDSVHNLGPPVNARPVNVPQHKGSLSLKYRNQARGLNVQLHGRAVESFNVLIGVYEGRVNGYGVVDFQMGYRLPFARAMTATLSVFNLLDNVHQEFVGTPAVGRLVVARLRFEL